MAETKTLSSRVRTNDGQIIPPVTIRIPMPKGAAVPARASSQTAPAESPKVSSSNSEKS
jgi:hypothetical protein